MAPGEVIDLLSSEDESPSKLLHSFQPRRKAAKGEPLASNEHREVESNSDPESRPQWPDHSRISPVDKDKGMPPVGPTSAVTNQRDLEVARGTLPSVQSRRQSFTPLSLTKEEWKVLGARGRKLQQDLARIQRDLDVTRKQSDLEKQQRIQRADSYLEQRRLAARKAGLARDHGIPGQELSSARGLSSSAADACSASAMTSRIGDCVDSSASSATHAGQAHESDHMCKSSIKRQLEISETDARSVKKRQVAPESSGRSQNTHSVGQYASSAVAARSASHLSSAHMHGLKSVSLPQDGASYTSSTATPDVGSSSQRRKAWTIDEDLQLKWLREIDGLSWDEISQHIVGRTRGTIKTRYFTAIKGRSVAGGTEIGQARNGPPGFLNSQSVRSSPNIPSTPPQSSDMEHSALRSLRTSHSDASDLPTPNITPPASSRLQAKVHKRRFTPQDNALLKKLKADLGYDWTKIHAYFPERTLPTLQVHYSTKVQRMDIDVSNVSVPALVSQSLMVRDQRSEAAEQHTVHKIPDTAMNGGNFGARYSAEEAALLKKLREEDRLDWTAMVPYFNGRTAGSLKVYWYTKLRHAGLPRTIPALLQSEPAEQMMPRSKRARNTGVAAAEGFLSWSDARGLMRGGDEAEAAKATELSGENVSGQVSASQDAIFPRSMGYMLQQRQFGGFAGHRGRMSSRCVIPEDLKNDTYKDYTLQRYYHGTSGDVVDLSWSKSGDLFAAGSIAISDHRSMQYNMSRNLLVGNPNTGELQELTEHHIARPVVDEADNPNASSAMRQTQDRRLFQTVTATAFSATADNEKTLFTTGTDKMLRMYSAATDVRSTKSMADAEHMSSVDLLAVHQEGLIATGCHSASGSISVFRDNTTDLSRLWTGSPGRQDLQTTASIYPSSLKWGIAYAHRNYLLAGFSGDEDKLLAGETVLWDMQQQVQIELKGVTRNVFDVCWNPTPSPASVVFAVASNSTGMNLGRGGRTAISCFAPKQPLSAVVRWQCPASDINDVLICPHNNQLIAAGATDGKVYVWDQRWAGQGQAPLHVFSHGDSLNVLPHGVDKELTDTGVRFLSWGATSSRLYSGSSDGIVKVWNPYRSAENAHVEDLEAPRQSRSAVMSGAFSPDYRELLVGTENGRIDLFKMRGPVVRKPEKFKLLTALEPQMGNSPFEAAESLLVTNCVQIQPCGAMPVKQVVQGDSYEGSFRAPSQEDVAEATRNLQSQIAIHLELAAKHELNSADQLSLNTAQMCVRDAEAAVHDLQDRVAFSQSSKSKAVAFQERLQQSEREHLDIVESARQRFGDEASPCQHDCAYLPASEELEDHGRADLRVPNTLKSYRTSALKKNRVDTEDMAVESCTRCSPARSEGHQARPELCLDCKLSNLRLTTKCSRCSAPSRIATSETKHSLCEACSFACFRCTRPAEVSDDSTMIHCKPCNLSWEAGVLGYDLIGSGGKAIKQAQLASEAAQEQYDDYGMAERERLADGWET